MRLKNPDQKFSSEAEGASADVLKQILGTAERKRARPASSLDVKVANGDQLTRPPKQIFTTQQLQQQKLQNELSSRAARGARGSRRNYDFSDLEGMTEEEIMQALYEDPELAAAATEASEKMHRAKKHRVPPKSTSSRRSRTVSEHPDHIRAMMDEGVPIKQWIILFLLLGVGLYQLRKTLVGSKKAAAVRKVDKHTLGRKGSKKTKKGGAKPAKKSRITPLVQNKHSPIEQELALEEQAPAVAVTVPKKTTSKKRKARKMKLAGSNTPPRQPAKKATSHESPDSVSTDGSSSTDDAVLQDDTMDSSDSENIGAVDVVIDQVIPELSPNDGWQTVGTVIVDEAIQEDPVQSVYSTPAKKPTKEDSCVPETAVVAEKFKIGAGTAESSKSAEKSFATKDAKKQEDESNDTMAFEVIKTQTEALDDEALALKLQLEEEFLANHEANKASHQDAWEEVSIKKKGKKVSLSS